MIPGVPSPQSAEGNVDAVLATLFALNGGRKRGQPPRPRTPPPRPGYTRVTSDDVDDE